MLENHTPFTDLVPKENRIKYTRKSSPYVRDASVADMPEIRLIPGQAIPHPQRTSNSSSILKRFEIEVRSGNPFIGEVLYPIEWEIYRALTKWAATLMALKWNHKTFVKLCRPTQIVESYESLPKTSPIGWQSVWSCEVELWFTTSDLV